MDLIEIKKIFSRVWGYNEYNNAMQLALENCIPLKKLFEDYIFAQYLDEEMLGREINNSCTLNDIRNIIVLKSDGSFAWHSEEICSYTSYRYERKFAGEGTWSIRYLSDYCIIFKLSCVDGREVDFKHNFFSGELEHGSLDYLQSWIHRDASRFLIRQNKLLLLYINSILRTIDEILKYRSEIFHRKELLNQRIINLVDSFDAIKEMNINLKGTSVTSIAYKLNGKMTSNNNEPDKVLLIKEACEEIKRSMWIPEREF